MANLRSTHIRLFLIFLFIFLFSLVSPAQTAADINMAESYAKKYSDDGVICVSSRKTFTFDIGKNELGDQVVQVTEESEYEFLSLKRFASIMFPEFYNKFIQ